MTSRRTRSVYDYSAKWPLLRAEAERGVVWTAPVGVSHTGFHAGSSPAKDEILAAAEAARRRVRIMSATLLPTLPHAEPVAASAARLALKTDGTSLGGSWTDPGGPGPGIC
jgi:hypothetical protein